MTTPAENIDENFTVNVTGVRLWSGQPISAGVVRSTYRRRKRPASVSSHPRSDRTRAPTSWQNEGSFETLPIAEAWWSDDRDGAYTYFWNSGTIPYIGILPYGHIPFPNPSVWGRADGDALDNAKNQKVDLGVALAEARQTAGMIGNTASRISRMVNDFRKKNPKKIWDAVKRGGRNIPSSYLEMSYGWSPLLQDVLGSAEALAEAMNLGHRLSIVVKGAARDQSNLLLRTEKPGLYDLVYTGSTSTRCEVVLRYDLPASLLPTLSSVGLTNPLSTIYEKVPYSFVLDWLLPVGDWLNRLDAGNYLTFYEGSRSVIARTNATSRYVRRSDFAYYYNNRVNTIRPGVLKGHSFTRYILLKPPSVPLPELRSPLSLDKMAKGLSLLATAFDRQPPRFRT